jgi:hypothetical protein
MTSKPHPLAFNELLDRPLIEAFIVAFTFLSFVAQDLILLFREACLTPELTRRPHEAFDLTGRSDDESHAIGRSG